MTFVKRFLPLIVFFAVLAVGYSVFALTEEDITFPVAELGDCETKDACKAYCDDSSHITECVAFAEKYSLLSSEEITKAKKFQEIGAKGPGGCTSERACESYCSNISNIEECLSFAEQHGFMEDHELEEARKVASALRQGAQLPGGCTNRDECESYCSDTSHMKECVEFGEKTGMIPPEELKEAKQVLKALEAGVKLPGNCKGKDECEAYCEEPSHTEECLNFALAAGFIPPEEAEQARKILPLMQQGKMPGGCRSKESCEAYCSQEQNVEECTVFFVEAGFMKPEEAELFRKTGGKGPGGCRGEQECNDFCNNPANQQACFEFGKEHGLISEDDLKNIEEGTSRFKEGFTSAPPEVAQCLKERVGEDVLSKIESGTFVPSPDLGEKMRSCFEEFLPRPPEGEDRGEFRPEGGPGFSNEPNECVQRILAEQQVQGAPSPEMEQKIRETCFPGPEPSHEGFQPEFQQQFEGQFKEEFNQQFQKEYQRQVEQQTQQFPTGEFKPPEGQFLPPPEEQFVPPPTDTFIHEEGTVAPPPETFTPDETIAPAPEGASLLDAAQNLLRPFFGR